MKRSFLILSILFLCLCSCSLSGDKANTNKLVLNDMNGVSYNLYDLKGRYTLVHYWATWCHVCKQELISLQNLDRALDKSKIQLLTVAIDSPRQSIQELKENYNLHLTILPDTDGAAKEAYKISDIPMSVLIDKEGKITKFIEPDSGKTVLKTRGPQSWDRPAVLKYFNSLN